MTWTLGVDGPLSASNPLRQTNQKEPKKKQKTGQLCSPCDGERKEEKVDLVGAAPRGQARRRDPTRWRPAAAPTRKQRHRHRVPAPVPVPVLLRAGTAASTSRRRSSLPLSVVVRVRRLFPVCFRSVLPTISSRVHARDDRLPWIKPD